MACDSFIGMDRAYGKAKQPVETDEVPQSFSFLHLTAARAFSEQLRAELAAAASTTIDAEAPSQPNGKVDLFVAALEQPAANTTGPGGLLDQGSRAALSSAR